LNKNKKILLAFYGDDFTGSTDALEFICKAGAKAMLFIEPPTKKQLEKYPDVDAYGVAGKTRSLSPDEMEKILLPAFKKMKATGAAHVHYKVCSTFDSSATIGSIGKAIDCGALVFKNKIVPVLGGTPALGRYCVFGNLFAQMGIGSDGDIYRIDRHPSMSKHPVTPMTESDLPLHLGKQTNKKIGLVNWLHQKNRFSYWEYIYGDSEIVLLDTITEGQLYKIGKWLVEQKEDEKPLFTVGSSAVEMALGKYWNDKKILSKKTIKQYQGNSKPLLVVSGSCSPVTKKQIEVAKENGFIEIIIDAVKISTGKGLDENTQFEINDLLCRNKNVIVHTGEKQSKNISSEKLGIDLGIIVKDAVKNSNCNRVIVCGGDTSSYAARAMEIEAVEMIASLVAGAPLCRVHSKNKYMNGLEVNFKGGQVGSENYFGFF
jgi:3-oxoisoapionate kinase